MLMPTEPTRSAQTVVQAIDPMPVMMGAAVPEHRWNNRQVFEGPHRVLVSVELGLE